MISVTIICPAMSNANVIATPSRGTSVTPAVTKNAPNNPPSHALGGASFTDVRFPSGAPENTTYKNRAIVPMRNDRNAERIGLSITAAILLLVAACVGIIAPAARAIRMYRYVLDIYESYAFRREKSSRANA